MTASIAAGLRALGVGEGDRVAAYMPNIPETVAAFLACASIGAIWSSAAPEFGARSVIDRFSQIEPKVLLASMATATAARTSTAATRSTGSPASSRRSSGSCGSGTSTGRAGRMGSSAAGRA